MSNSVGTDCINGTFVVFYRPGNDDGYARYVGLTDSKKNLIIGWNMEPNEHQPIPADARLIFYPTDEELPYREIPIFDRDTCSIVGIPVPPPPTTEVPPIVNVPPVVEVPPIVVTVPPSVPVVPPTTEVAVPPSSIPSVPAKELPFTGDYVGISILVGTILVAGGYAMVRLKDSFNAKFLSFEKLPSRYRR